MGRRPGRRASPADPIRRGPWVQRRPGRARRTAIGGNARSTARAARGSCHRGYEDGRRDSSEPDRVPEGLPYRMRWFRLAAALALLLVACEPRPGSRSPSDGADATQEPSSQRDLSFPGGGRILFLGAIGAGYDPRGIGLVQADGTLRRYPRDGTFPYWDPVAPDRLLLVPGGPPTRTVSSGIEERELRRLDAWHTSEIP